VDCTEKARKKADMGLLAVPLPCRSPLSLSPSWRLGRKKGSLMISSTMALQFDKSEESFFTFSFFTELRFW